MSILQAGLNKLKYVRNSNGWAGLQSSELKYLNSAFAVITGVPQTLLSLLCLPCKGSRQLLDLSSPYLSQPHIYKIR